MKRMKKIIIILFAAAALISCGKETPSGKNDNAKREFDAWIEVNHPGIEPTALGSYILEQNEGTGAPVADSAFVRVEVTSRYLGGSIYSTTSEKLARQVGSYSPSGYYGPIFWYRTGNSQYAGLEELVSMMKVGGSMVAVVPGWLNTFRRYSNAEGYLKKVTGTNLIYDIKIVDAFNDESAWEADSLSRYIAANYPAAVKDTVLNGFWFVSIDDGDTDTDPANESNLKLNYTGRRLDGTVFDTTDKETAILSDIYNSSSSYSSKSVTWDSDYTKIQMSGSSVIKGFAYAISKMHPGGKAICFFISEHGYANTGSGAAIPAYCPLSFELELIKNE